MKSVGELQNLVAELLRSRTVEQRDAALAAIHRTYPQEELI